MKRENEKEKKILHLFDKKYFPLSYTFKINELYNII